jgi:DUF1365 family protein
MRSALYLGRVRHRRFHPSYRAFGYRVGMVYVDLDELDGALGAELDRHLLWSRGGHTLVSFRRSDYLGDPEVPLRQSVEELVVSATGRRPTGPIGVLSNLRTAGVNFNPISCYYCFDSSGELLTSVVLEVTNTPWGERHHYVIDLGEGERSVRGASLDKQMHVSPFLEMDCNYRVDLGAPRQRLDVRIEVERHGGRLLDADLWLERHPITARSLTWFPLAYPLTPIMGLISIYTQALRCALSGVPYHRHPSTEERAA